MATTKHEPANNKELKEYENDLLFEEVPFLSLEFDYNLH